MEKTLIQKKIDDLLAIEERTESDKMNDLAVFIIQKMVIDQLQKSQTIWTSRQIAHTIKKLALKAGIKLEEEKPI